MSDRGRVLAICAGVALVAGGAGFYFFKIYQPGQQLKDAQGEITAWEQRYQDARDCLLGKSPGSTKTSEALAIREMAPDPWDRGKCTPLVSKLTRGPANDTGVEAVEAAWTDLDKSAQAAALAFAKHVDSSTTLDQDPLPAALDALDAARGKLRSAARLPASDHGGAALAAAQVIPLVDGKEPVTELLIDALPSAHGLVLFGKTASRQVQVALVTGDTPKVARVGSGSMRGVPDATWGATASRLVARGKGKGADTTGQVVVGAMDGEGAIASPTTLAVTAPLPVQGASFASDVVAGDEVGSVLIAAAAGSLAQGAIVYGAMQTFVVARAKDGKLAADAPIKIETASATTDVDGRIAIVWTAVDKVSRALVRKADGGEETFELPASFAGPPCLTNDRVWLMANEPELYAFGGGKPLARTQVAPNTGLQGCTADAAIVRKRNRPREVNICTDHCRKVLVPSGAPEYSAVTAVGGKLRAIAAHAGVLGVWSEDNPPVFYSLPVQAQPVLGQELPAMAPTNGNVIDVIARADKKVVVIRIPAR